MQLYFNKRDKGRFKTWPPRLNRHEVGGERKKGSSNDMGEELLEFVVPVTSLNVSHSRY